MKKTELKDVYCVPKTKEDWKQLDDIHGFNVVGEENGFTKQNDIVVYEPEGLYQACLRLEDSDIKEIQVSKFIDLLEDRIVGWRLEEIGFKESGFQLHELELTDCAIVIDYCGGITTVKLYQDKGDFVSYLNISTFTELETLIRFLK